MLNLRKLGKELKVCSIRLIKCLFESQYLCRVLLAENSLDGIAVNMLRISEEHFKRLVQYRG